jgi:hypothetical protein
MIFQRFICLLILCLGFDLSGLASEKPLAGREIFRQQCVKCHGRSGEGVKGKYDSALHGNWSLEKLTRYIDKNMPDDAPETCVGPQASAVAHYIYDAFYSREARLRNHPPRIELVHLTNRQYVHTVADLLKQFTGPDARPGNEHGLHAHYRSNFRKSSKEPKTIERVDRQINFHFETNSADAEMLGAGTNEISITWRGSLLAEESGDYQFLLKTPNGARLWVNDEENPLIDAWVASGQDDEHSATLRLLGGRAYPLRMEYFKAAKDKSASASLSWKPPHGTHQLIPARQLSTSKTTPTFVVTTPFPPDDSSVGYERGVAVSKAWDEAATKAALEVAGHVVQNLNRLSQSKLSDTNRAAKVQAFCNEFLGAAFRRPLTEQQKRFFVSAHFKTAPKVEDAVKRVVLLGLKSPRFLYLGLESGQPDDFEVAARLAFGLWDSLPDAQLRKLAGGAALHTREQVREQARRMLADTRAHSKIRYFLHHWLQVDHVEDLSKDATLFPGFTPEIIADLRTSLDLFLDDVVWNGGSDYRKLLLADYLFMNERLASFYGVSTNAGEDFVKVTFEPEQRSGIITHPYLLAEFSYPKSSSPIHRGVFLTRNIVGRALKPPPMAQVFKDSDFAPDLTMREKVAEMTRPQACQSCHSVINPLGFSLENFDAVGRFQTRQGGKAINPVSDYTADEGQTIRFTGARDVARFAAGSEQAQNGFVEQLFHHIVKQPMLAYGADTMDRLRQTFVTSEFNLQNLLVEITTVSALHGLEKAPRDQLAKGK